MTHLRTTADFRTAALVLCVAIMGTGCSTMQDDQHPNDAGGDGGGQLAADAGMDAGPLGVDTSQCAPGPTEGNYPCAVANVLQAKCWTCHMDPPVDHAPFSLLTFGDAAQEYTFRDGGTEQRWQRMSQVILPGSVPHMPFGNAAPLTTEEFQTLEDWFAGCAAPIADAGTCNPDGG